MVTPAQPLLEISELTAINQRRPSSEVERRLVELRCSAFAELDPVSDAEPWPPNVPDLFPGETRFPEIHQQELTGAVLRSAVFHHGALLVRGLLDGTTAEHLVAEIDEVLEARAAHGGGQAPGAQDSLFVPFEPPDTTAEGAQEFARELRYGRALLDAQGCVLAVDAPHVFFELIEIFDRRGIRDLATAFFGERPAILGKKWTLRRASPDQGDADRQRDQSVSNPGWHQDGSFMGDVRSLNVWIALSHCGADAPSIDVVARRLDHIVETGTHGAPYTWAVGPAVAERVAGGAIVRPRFEPGDALLFDHLLLHKTDTRPETTLPRYAIEAWLASGSSYPPDQMPMVY